MLIPISRGTDDPAVAALLRLVRIAQGDTGQSRHAADFLLAWWNAADCGGWDLTDLWGVDDAIADDMLAVAALIARRRGYHPDAYGFGPTFAALVARWRPHLLARSG